MNKNYLMSNEQGNNGIYRGKLISAADDSEVRVYIPGLHNINPFDENGNVNMDNYEQYKDIFPKVQWCCYNLESKEVTNQDPLVWIMFENGDNRRPVVISYAVIGGSGSGDSDYNGGSGSSGENTSTEYDIVGGTIVDAIFTAYYATPDNYSSAENKLEGGPIAANGETLDYTKFTCAAPPEIEINENIKVLDTNTSQDGNIYRVNDRGGAIKVVDGVYHFDLLMKDKETANAFGKVFGKAIIHGILQKRYQTDDSASNVAKKAIELAVKIANDNSCNYVYGAKGPKNFDCSGFVWYCYNKSGLSNLSYAATGFMVSTYTSVGFEDITSGVDLSSGNGLITGDILLNVAGGHVDMYVGGGKRVGAHSSSTGIYVDNYSWNQKGYNNKYDHVLRYKG